MLKKKTKIVILCAMVLLLGVTGYLNIALNKSVTTASNNVVTTTNYFDTYRTDRQNTRDQSIMYYDAIINSEASSEENIESATKKKDEIVKTMELELVMEGLIKAKGFEDAIVTSSTENVNVVVQSAELSSTQVAQIVSVVMNETSLGIDNIKIIPID